MEEEQGRGKEWNVQSCSTELTLIGKKRKYLLFIHLPKDIQLQKVSSIYTSVTPLHVVIQLARVVTLCLSNYEANILLRHSNWDAYKLQYSWFTNEPELRHRDGLSAPGNPTTTVAADQSFSS
ncbi:unnamed protein product [Linum trigynum]|uniref:Uncharacterized protein n=1 Tax=Linum trigynum TaxID=586398 RepID=A0AAV2GVD2_9ROSI